MRALRKLHAKPGLWLSEEAVPIPHHGDIRIKILKTAICGTDLHIYQWDEWAQNNVPVPLTTGHEFVGIIDALGDGVTHFNIGDRVSGEGHLTCQHCRNCRAGNQHLCRDTVGVGVNRPGAFADYIVIPAANAYPIPDNISDDEAAMLDPYGNAVHATLSYDLVGEDVLVTGAGPIGLMSAAIAKHVGARHVVITDINPFRLKMAKKMGIEVAINPQETSLSQVMKDIGMKEGFDVGLEMSGSELAFRDMITHMNHGGKMALLGILKNDIGIAWQDIIFKSLVIKGVYGREIFDTWYKGISMLQSGLDITPVITQQLPATKFDAGFQVMLSGQAGKVILDWA